MSDAETYQNRKATMGRLHLKYVALILRTSALKNA